MKRLITDEQIEAINRKWRCGGNGHFDWASEIESVIRAEAEERIALAIKAMQTFTPAIDAALWVALEWNDHNHNTDTIFAHAKRAADGLGLQRGGPDRRDELFTLWNSALAALRPNVELRGAEPACRRSVPLERRVGGAGDQNPLFELRGPDGKTWMLYEDGTATGFPEGTVIVNRARPQLDLLRGRIKEFEAALIADQQ